MIIFRRQDQNIILYYILAKVALACRARPQVEPASEPRVCMEANSASPDPGWRLLYSANWHSAVGIIAARCGQVSVRVRIGRGGQQGP